MCVIFCCDRVRPTDDMVERAYEANNSGAGIAWREGGLVRWEKGLTVEAIKELCTKAPIPFVAHFRIPSCGGDSVELCHPFPIEKEVGLELSGSINGFVLFHNGHWTPWKEKALDTLTKKDAKLPDGDWSDTRVMAWLASIYGTGVLSLIDEKTVILGPNPKDIEAFGSGWSRANEVLVSNKFWENRHIHRGNMGFMGMGGDHDYASTMCRNRTCAKQKLYNSDFCIEHQPADVVNGKKELGGDSEDPSFRDAAKVIQGGRTDSETIQQAAKEAGEETGGTAVKVVGDDETLDPTSARLLEQFRWARSFNPKRLLPPHRDADNDQSDRAERTEQLRQGIMRIGPM